MTETELKYLKEARLNLVREKDQEALEAYMKVREENSDNPEAKYFVLNTYCTNCIDQGESNQNKKNAFLAVSDALDKAIRYVATSEGGEDEKFVITARFVGMYLPIAAYVVTAQITSPAERIQTAAVTLYKAGNAIEDAYGSASDNMKIAAMAWKEAVKLQRQFYAYTYEGNKAEDYAAKIQKVEPDYVMPKKAGCISAG